MNTGSDAAVRWAQDQICTCRESHRPCNIEGHSTLPDRVLRLSSVNVKDIELEENSLEADVRSYESRGEESTDAALSPRWGDHQPLCLKVDNIADLRHSIPGSRFLKRSSRRSCSHEV